MKNNLATVFTPNNLDKVFSAALTVSQRTGAKTGKLVFNDGTMRIQTVTKTGVGILKEYVLPALATTAEKIVVAKDLHKNGMRQVDIADLLHVTQPTVSNWLKK